MSKIAILPKQAKPGEFRSAISTRFTTKTTGFTFKGAILPSKSTRH